MQITASLVKELRERTGAGMMECKKALVEAGGDIDVAIEQMRKSGAAKADKKAGRVAAEGMVVISMADDNRSAAMVEINCETDFVTKGDDFQDFARAVAAAAAAGRPADIDALAELSLSDHDGLSVEQQRKELIAKIGENINVRRFALFETAGDRLGAYSHGARIGVVVDLKGGDDATARDVAMHVAASRPVCVSDAQVPADVIAKEKDIFTAQAAESGKPPEIIEKMIGGRVKKFLKEITLLGQPFVKNPDQNVDKYLKGNGAEALSFVRFEVGEGIEKKSENFAEEVMAQIGG